ncbi:MAG TPA: type II secretion system F family protein [Verrucomicrobiae bacterium]|nr:type II secretion system F family protein [Verrucomicrobiae bacterium]
MSGLGSILFFLISGAVFTALIWSTLEFFRAEENPLEDRLDDLGSQAMVATGARPTRFKTSGTGFDRFLYVISLAPGAADWMRGSERLLRRAGFRSKQALAIYVFLFLIFVTLVLTGMGLLQRGNNAFNATLAMVAALVIGVMLPKMILERLVKRYRRKLEEALPDTIDLLGIVLGTGLALDQAMLRVSEEMQFIYPELAGEFTTVVMQVRAGQERAKSFDQLVRRTGVEAIKSLAAMIIQSEKFGTSLALALKVYADDLRKKRTRKAEEAVAKAGIKMLFPVILFILPVLFIITLVPAFLTVIRNLQLLGGPR